MIIWSESERHTTAVERYSDEHYDRVLARYWQEGSIVTEPWLTKSATWGESNVDKAPTSSKPMPP